MAGFSNAWKSILAARSYDIVQASFQGSQKLHDSIGEAARNERAHSDALEEEDTGHGTDEERRDNFG